MLPFRASVPASAGLVAFGKGPWTGDFLRVGAPGRAGEGLEQWVEQGLERAEGRLGATWASAYGRGSMHAFVYRAPRASGATETLVGVILPSSDAVGRRFPLLAYAPLAPTGQVPWPHVLPIVLGGFFDRAAEVLHGSGAFAATAELAAAISTLSPPDLGGGQGEAGEYDAWTSSALLSQAWAAIYGEAGSGRAAHAIHVIADAVAPFRGAPAPATTLGLRLPLGSGGVAAAAFWLDVIRRLAGSPHEVRTAFWSFDGTHGQAIVQLGDTPASTLAELWAPDTDSDHLCDLTESSNVDVSRLLSGAPPPVVEALHAPETLVCDFLDLLAR